MRLTFHTDYALRMLMCLAARPDKPWTVSDVATRYGISRNHLLKVALNLGRMGFVKTSRGRSGGIALARPAGQINLGDLVRRMEDDFALVECMQPAGGSCVISPACRLKGVMKEALETYLAVFDRYTLADLSCNVSELATLLEIPTPDCETAGAST